MAEISYPWDGVATGDATAAPYDAPTVQALWNLLLSGIIGIETNRGGVFQTNNTGTGTEDLTPSVGAGQILIDPGYALNYGTLYYNSTQASVVIPTPAASTREDYIVLRKDWAAQTVRITRVAGIEGAGLPDCEQDAGNLWDIPLASISVTTGGVITLTDLRQFILSAPFPAICVIVNDPAVAMSIPTAGAPHKVGFNTAIVQTLSAMYSSGNDKIDIVRSGLYKIRVEFAEYTVNTSVGQFSVGNILQIHVYKNGSPLLVYDGATNYLAKQVMLTISTDTFAFRPSLEVACVELADGDYIEVFVEQSSGADITISSPCYALLEVRQVGPAGGIVLLPTSV